MSVANIFLEGEEIVFTPRIVAYPTATPRVKIAKLLNQYVVRDPIGYLSMSVRLVGDGARPDSPHLPQTFIRSIAPLCFADDIFF